MNRFRSPLQLASVTQYLVLINVVIYAVQILLQPRADLSSGGDVFSLLSLHRITWFELKFGLITPIQFPDVVWQVLTSNYLHGSLLHIFLNMFVLWQFGHALERVWGSKYFIQYYLFTGIGSSITVILLSLFTHDFSITIGASGAVFGLLLAYGVLFPNNTMLIFMIIPMPAKYAVIVIGALTFFFLISGGMPGISHIGHLGGLIFGFIMLQGRGILRKL